MRACQLCDVLQEVLTGYMKTNVQAILENITPKVGWAGDRSPGLPPTENLTVFLTIPMAPGSLKWVHAQLSPALVTCSLT